MVAVNHAFRKRYFPAESPVGRKIIVQWSNQAPAEIIAVVGDVRHNGLTSEPTPTVFLLHSQTPGYITNLVVRTTGDPHAQAAAVRSAIHEVDRTQAVSNVKTMDEYLRGTLARPRLYAVLVTSFATLAVILAAMGIYGLIAYLVAQRTNEIGIRLALGATPGGIFGSIFWQGALLTFIGLVIGIAATLGVREIVSSLLFGVTTGDPVSHLVAITVFATVAVVASSIPALRASRVNPMTALRYE